MQLLFLLFASLASTSFAVLSEDSVDLLERDLLDDGIAFQARENTPGLLYKDRIRALELEARDEAKRFIRRLSFRETVTRDLDDVKAELAADGFIQSQPKDTRPVQQKTVYLVSRHNPWDWRQKMDKDDPDDPS